MLLNVGRRPVAAGELSVGGPDPRCAEIIRSASDARSLLAVPRSKSSLVEVSVPGATEEQCRRWEKSLNESLAECGCELGSRFTVVAVGLSTAVGLIARAHGTPIRRLPLLAVSAVVVAAGSGKNLALARARARIAGTATAIEWLELDQHHRGLSLEHPSQADPLQATATAEQERT